MTDKTQKQLIEEQMGFYKQNPNVPCVFEHTEIPEVRSNATKIKPMNQSSIDSSFDISIDGEMKRITYNGADDIYSDKLYDRDGDLKKGISLERIFFKNRKVILFGNTNDKKTLRAMEYLFTLAICYPATYDKDIVKHINIEEQTQSSTVNEIDKFKLAKLVEELSKIADGKLLLSNIAKRQDVLYEHYNNIDAYLSKPNGINIIRDELIKVALSNPQPLGNALQFKFQKELVNDALKLKLIEYNPKTECFQYKDIKGDYIKDDILFKVKSENSEIRLLLLYNALLTDQELSNTLNFRIQNAKS